MEESGRFRSILVDKPEAVVERRLVVPVCTSMACSYEQAFLERSLDLVEAVAGYSLAAEFVVEIPSAFQLRSMA